MRKDVYIKVDTMEEVNAKAKEGYVIHSHYTQAEYIYDHNLGYRTLDCTYPVYIMELKDDPTSITAKSKKPKPSEQMCEPLYWKG